MNTVSLTESSNHKVVIIDEADYMNAAVPAKDETLLRLFIIIVDLSLLVITRTRFYILHSRCAVIDFAIKNGQKVKTAQALLIDYQRS